MILGKQELGTSVKTCIKEQKQQKRHMYIIYVEKEHTIQIVS